MEERKKSILFIVFLGIVSLFADMVYETVRGVMGPYLSSLGATAFAIGFVFGFGEFIGYALRIVSGILSDRTRQYWTFVFLGYGMILFIPLLAFSQTWVIASVFIIMERIGKAIRNPARDTLLANYSKGIGKGLVYGIHEATDQIGAILGPALFSLLLILDYGYQKSFLFLFIPSALVILFLIIAKLFSGRISVESEAKLEKGFKKSTFYLYIVFIFISSIGFVGFPLVSYNMKINNILNETMIPMTYALIMTLDAIAAIPVGKLYDKIGIKTLFSIPILITILIPLVFSKSIILVSLGLVIWGIVMAMHETIIRAFVGETVPVSERGKYFGIFNTVLGLSLMLGNSLIGLLYPSVNYIITFVSISQLIAIAILMVIMKTTK